MKNTKRFLALVLALTMCIATLASVSAATAAWYASAVDFIETCGIDTIGSKASAKITRNDFVYWIAKVVTHQVADGAWDEAVIQDEVSFSDVTAAHHIAAIANSQQMGYLKGDGNGKFYPDDALTLAEVSAIIVRVMGYESKVTGLTQDWKYNYMLVANLYCNAFDSTFMAQTGTADPDYELSYGEAAYILATIMNFPGKPVTALESLTADGYDLGAWFRGNQAGTSTYTAVVTDIDYVVEYTGNYILHTTDIIDTTGTVDLVFTFADGSTEVVTMNTLDFQGYIRVSQGLSAEIDWRNEEVYNLSTYVTNGTTVSVKYDNATGEFLSIKVLDGDVVDTFAVLKSTGSAKYVPWLANAVGGTDYTMQLPVAYTDDVHFQFVDVAYAADGTVTSAAFQIGTQQYNISSTYVGATNLVFYSLLGTLSYGTNEPTADELEVVEAALTTPLTAAEVYELLPTTATGMARFVITDVDGDGYYDTAVITDNYNYVYRSKLNANPSVTSSATEDKSYEMGAVVAGYTVTVVRTSVSTDMFGWDVTKPTNDVVLVIPASNKRWITQEGAGYLGDANPNGGHSMLPAFYTDVKLPYELKSAYIESATALAVDGYYRVVLVNLDGTRTTAYMPIPTGTVVTTDVSVPAVDPDTGLPVVDQDTGDVVYEEYEDLVVYKIARGWTMYRLDDEFDSVEGWYAYEDNDVFSAGEEITTDYLGSTEVDGKYEYIIYDFIPMTTDVTVTIGGLETVVTLDSSTWVPFLTDYTREADGGPNGALVDGVYVVNVDDTAAWMVNKYIKYAVDADNKVLFALDTTRSASQQGLIISVAKTDTGANTYNVTLGVTATQTTTDAVVINYGDARWTYSRWGAWHDNVITVNKGSGSSVATIYCQGAYNKYTENEKYAILGFELLDFVDYVNSKYGSVIQLSAAENGEEQIQSMRNTGAYFANCIKALRTALLALSADDLAALTAETTFADLVGTAAESGIASGVVGRYVICLGTPLHWGSCSNKTSIEEINLYIATVDQDSVFDTSMTIAEFFETLTDSTVDGETWLAALQATEGDAKTIARGTYVYEMLQQACDVYMSGYWWETKTAWTYGNSYISDTLEYRGVKSVITREVRASASSLLDWANYEAYNRIFQNGILVHDIAVDDVLEGYHLSYGEFYQDAGELAILKYIGSDLEDGDSRVHFYKDSEGSWAGYYFSANNALGNNGWESKGVMNFRSTTRSEANSLIHIADVVLIEGPTLVEGTKEFLDNGVDFVAQYEVKFARDPYYLRTSNPAYTKYWTEVTTAVIEGTTVAREGKTYYTYIPVVDGNNKQYEAKTAEDVRYWTSLGVDALSVDAKYAVIDGLVYKINTITETFVYDAEGNIVMDTTYDFDDVVDVVETEEDVPVDDADVKSMITIALLTKDETGYFPGAYKVTFEGETYIASGDVPVVVMAPNYKTGDVQGKAWTVRELAENNLGVWATRKFVKHGGNSLEALTFIGETVSLTAAPIVDPGTTTPQPTTNRTVYVANGESVIEQLETGKSYVVKSLYSAVELPSGTEVGSVSVGYSTYVEAKAAKTIAPVIDDGKFYLIDKDNNILSTVAITWYTGTITSATADGAVKATLNNVEYEGKDLKWAFFYMDLDHTYLALASDNTSVQVASEATAKTAVTTAKTKAATAKAAYENAVATGLSAAKVASYKAAYDEALAAVTAAEETAVAKYLNGTFWGVEGSPAYNYLVIGKLTYQDNPAPITFNYTVIGGTYCVLVNSFFNV
jgi:hypothetical protein